MSAVFSDVVRRLTQVSRWRARVARCGLLLLVGGYASEAQAHPHAQDSEVTGTPVWAFFGGYTAHELADPGVHLGAEYSLATAGTFESLVAAAFQFYSEADLEAGFALQARWGHRYTSGTGITFGSYLGLGVQYTRYQTTLFEFQDSIATRREIGNSRVAVSPHVVFGPGYSFEQMLGIPVSIYVRAGVMLLYPDLNRAFQASLIGEFGLRWGIDF